MLKAILYFFLLIAEFFITILISGFCFGLYYAYMDVAVLFWVIIVLGFVVGMRRRSSPRCSGRCVRGNKPANLADCYANNDRVQSTLRPCRGGNAGKCADIRWM